MENKLSLRATLKILFIIAALLISSDNAYALRKLRILVYPFQNTGSYSAADNNVSITGNLMKVKSSIIKTKWPEDLSVFLKKIKTYSYQFEENLQFIN